MYTCSDTIGYKILFERGGYAWTVPVLDFMFCRINSKFDDSGRYFLSLFISVRKHVDRGRMCRL